MTQSTPRFAGAREQAELAAVVASALEGSHACCSVNRLERPHALVDLGAGCGVPADARRRVTAGSGTDLAHRCGAVVLVTRGPGRVAARGHALVVRSRPVAMPGER
jgi:hypothetical protein